MANDVEILDLFLDAVEHSVPVHDTYRRKLSPSQFPICPVLSLLRTSFQDAGYKSSSRSGALEIFAGIGENTHLAVQYHLGFSGKLWGRWACKNKSCRLYVGSWPKKGERRFSAEKTTDNICPCCGRPMEYIELKVYRGTVRGKIDVILKFDDGTFGVYDIKSATVRKVENNDCLKSHQVHQVRSYVRMLTEEKRYGVGPISRYGLVYVARDNPRKMLVESFRYTKSEDAAALKFLNSQRDRYMAYKHDYREGTVVHSIDHKPCRDSNDYFDNMHSYDECPMLPVCFSQDKLQSTMEEFVRQCKSKRLDSNMTFKEALDSVISKHVKIGLDGKPQAQVGFRRQL